MICVLPPRGNSGGEDETVTQATGNDRMTALAISM
jgi:hypothetical protein